MNDLENEVKPILGNMLVHGAASSIMPRGIASLAAYAFKTAVIGGHMRTDRRQFFTRSECARFAKTLELPPNVQAWIAAMRSRADRSGKFKTTYAKTPRGYVPSFELYVCTFAIGYVVLQLVATHFKRSQRIPFLGVIQDSKWDDFSIPLWPSNSNPILWPTRQHLSDDTIQAFCDRWRDFSIPQWMTRL